MISKRTCVVVLSSLAVIAAPLVEPSCRQAEAAGDCFERVRIGIVEAPCNQCSLSEGCGGWSARDPYLSCGQRLNESQRYDIGILCEERAAVLLTWGSCSIHYSTISKWCLAAAIGLPAAGCAVGCLVTGPGWGPCVAACAAAFAGGIAGMMYYICECTTGCEQNTDGGSEFVTRNVYQAPCSTLSGG